MHVNVLYNWTSAKYCRKYLQNRTFTDPCEKGRIWDTQLIWFSESNLSPRRLSRLKCFTLTYNRSTTVDNRYDRRNPKNAHGGDSKHIQIHPNTNRLTLMDLYHLVSIRDGQCFEMSLVMGVCWSKPRQRLRIMPGGDQDVRNRGPFGSSSALVTFQFHGYYGKSMGKTTMNNRPITLKSALAHFFLRFPQILIKKWNQPARIKEKNGNTAGAAAVLNWVRLIFVGKPYN